MVHLLLRFVFIVLCDEAVRSVARVAWRALAHWLGVGP